MAFNMFANSTTKDYYKVLNLSNNADRKDIRAAYHELALRYHPDKTGGDALALCQFQAVQEAFDILGNPDSKSEYDQSRAPAAFNQAADEENADEDIDQMIWDGWQAPFNGQKSSLFYQSTGASHQGGYFGQSNQLETSQAVSTKTRLGECSSFGNSSQDGHDAASTGATGDQGDAISISSGEETGDSGTPKDAGLSNPSPPSPNHWSYNDYYDIDYNEKPLLQELRDKVEATKVRYRNACKAADKARVDINYATTAEEREHFEEVFRLRCDTRESHKTVKSIRETKLKAHEKLAKQCMRVRKKQDKEDEAAAKKEAAILQKLRQHRQDRAKTTASGFGSYRVKKPRSAKRNKWYGADSGDESEGEWSKDTKWTPWVGKRRPRDGRSAHKLGLLCPTAFWRSWKPAGLFLGLAARQHFDCKSALIVHCREKSMSCCCFDDRGVQVWLGTQG